MPLDRQVDGDYMAVIRIPSLIAGMCIHYKCRKGWTSTRK